MESRSRFRRVLPHLVFLGCAAGFLAVHLASYVPFLQRFLERVPAGSPASTMSFGRQVTGFSLLTLATFVAFAVPTVAIARKTRDRILWILPVAAYVLWPLPARLVLQDGTGPILKPLFEAPAMGSPSLFALVQLLLVAAAAVPAVLLTSKSERRVDSSARMSVAILAAAGFVLYLERQVGANGAFDVNTANLMPLAFLFVVGAALGVKRPWFPAVHLLSAFLLSESLFVVIDWLFPAGFFSLSTGAHLRLVALGVLPGLTAVGLGAATEPLSRLLRTRRGRAGVPAPEAA